MKLNELLSSVEIIPTLKTQNIQVNGIAFNSKNIKEGYLFVAISGTHSDGHTYIEDALTNGAIAVVGEQELFLNEVPYFQVKDARKALAFLARTFYKNPTNNKTIIGITGTNGKTTTSYMLKHILESQGISCAVFGSISIIINNEEYSSTHTTLDPLTFHELAAKSKDQVIIMEVSSHGLVQQRVEGLEFDYCIFTNIEHEHLDYHKDMESYYLAKQSLFTYLKSNGKAILLSSNDWSERLNTYVNSLGREVIKINGSSPTYTIDIDKIIEQQTGKVFSLTTQMQGEHNINNAAAAFATSVHFGLDPKRVELTLNNFKGIPGRYQLFPLANSATAVVDYAHTANAFHYILDTVKSQNARMIYHVFGFRGNRDVQKRARMIEMSLKYADRCILTFDDLNGVPAEQMINELENLGAHEKCVIYPDRTEAIKYAWEIAGPGDWIVITGKGNEAYKQSYSLSTKSDIDTLNYLLSTKHSAKPEIESLL
ncbi:UDP-N-acetylmuramoyl-L-alanyl-D-glutamate--2,6-diaminopimelate ligase [Psychrobacillus sp. FSL W7-1493]|uniref:UDP-N-acetylmuramoyl-L-alanyl-D-glutamate--2, 6-diaminopimelate ligase n=1 Tax=unclassified Psychrobacillus TaxID=2636677 RepID=UPI0030F7C476